MAIGPFTAGFSIAPNHLKNATLIFLAVLAAYTLTAGGHLYSPDEEILFRTTRSIYEDRDLAIEPLGGFATARAEDGREYAQYGIGQPLLAVPFYAIGKWIAPLASDASWKSLYGIADEETPETRDDLAFSPTADQIAPRFVVSFFNIFISALLAAVLYLLLLDLTEHTRASVLATLLFAFGSLAWAHSRPFFTETLAVFSMLLAWRWIVAWIETPSPWRMVAAGAAAGFAALVRMDSVLLYPGLAILLLGPVRDASRDRTGGVHPWILFCAPAVLCGVVLLGLNKLHFDGFFATGYSDQPEGVRFSTPILAGLYGLLFSVGKGMFFFSPALVVSFFGWRPMWSRDRALTLGVAICVALPLLILAKWQNWAGGWCWGPRHIVMIHPFLAIPIAVWLAANWGRTQRLIAIGFLTVGVFVQLLGSSQDFMQFYRIYYREYGRHARVQYDSFDQEYWARYLTLTARNPSDLDQTREVPLGYAPAPTQHSLYLPGASQWSFYPKMWREDRTLDNLWFRIASEN